MILITLMLSVPVMAQSDVYPFDDVHGYPHYNLSGTGMALGVSPSLAGVAVTNPAAMTEWPANLAGIAYHAESSVDPGSSNSYHMRRARWRPSMIGVVEPWMEAGVGLGYVQRYNRLTQGSSSGSPYYEEVLVEGLASCMSQRYDLKRAGAFDLGVRIEYLRMYYSYGTRDLAGGPANSGELEDTFYGWAVGARWKRQFKHFRVEIGSQYETFTGVNATMSMRYASREVHAQLPTAIHTGLILGDLPWVDLVLGWSHIRYSEVSDNLNDRDDFSASVVWRGPAAMRVNLGAWTSGIDEQDNDDSELNTVYLQTGISYQIDNALMEIALADSHFLGGEYRKQTILRLAVSYTMH